MNKLTLLISALFFISQVFLVNGYLIGIDLGTEFFKATMLRPGRPFTMVENIQSKTKTPTSLSFKDDERSFGADALVKKPRLPKGVLTFFHEYLAKKYDSQEIKKFIDNYFISYEMEEDSERGTINLKFTFNNEEFKFSAEEVFGMLFRYIKFLSDKFSQSEIKDCVVTVPAFYSYKERQALAQAVEMSKLNLLGFVTENTAAAVQFAQNKNFNSTEYYVFYNMGASYTQATLVSFVSKFETKKNKTIETGKTLNVLGETWDKELGGNLFNINLVRHLMAKFDSLPARKGKPSIINDYKVAERILPSANKYKEILSANKDVPVAILSVDSGMNLETRITRDEFEEINSKEFMRAYDPIEKLLNRTGITLDQISQIELIGGSIRVPKVQEVIKTKMGNYSSLVGTHMNGDDSMALGAAYVCANFSSNFKGGKVELYHGANYEVKVKITNLDQSKVCEENAENADSSCSQKLEKATVLYKHRYGLDLARSVSFKHDGDVLVTIFENFEDEQENLIASYKITGMDKVKESMSKEEVKATPKINLRFKQDAKGLITLKADSSIEQTLYLALQTSPTGGIEVVYQSNVTQPLTDEEIKQFEDEIKEKNFTESAKTNLINMRKDVGKKKTKEQKIDLEVAVEYSKPRPLTKEEISASKLKLDKLDQIDANRIKTMEKRNALETLIYAKKEWLDSKDSGLYAKDGEAEISLKGLNEISEWYEEDGYGANLELLEAKYNMLNDLFRHFDRRLTVHKKRNHAIDTFNSEIKTVQSDAEKLLKSRPYIENSYNNTFLKEVKIVSDWFVEIKEKQDALALYEEAVLTHDLIDAKISILKREYLALNRIPKPKPAKIDNPKMEDFMNMNSTNFEEMIKRANKTKMTKEDVENIADFINKKKEENKKDFENQGETEPTTESENSSESTEETKPEL